MMIQTHDEARKGLWARLIAGIMTVAVMMLAAVIAIWLMVVVGLSVMDVSTPGFGPPV